MATKKEAKAEKQLPEFATPWHQQQHADDLEREIAGRIRRKEELEASGGATQKTIDEVDAEIQAAKAELRRVAGK